MMTAPGSPVWRGLRVLVRSAPLGVAGLAAAQAAVGIAPAVIVGATAQLLDSAALSGTDARSRRDTVLALAAITAALVVSRAAGACAGFLYTLVSTRFTAAVDRLRISAVGRLPGLAHFDDPKLADSLQAGEWAAEASALVSYSASSLQWGVRIVGTGAVAARVGWWVPAVVVATVLPSTVNNWRHAGTQKKLHLKQVSARRRASYQAQLATELGAAREIRLFGLGDWLIGRQRTYWREAMNPVFDDMRQQLRANLLSSCIRMAVLSVPFVIAFRRLDDGTLSIGAFTAAILAIAAMAAPALWVESLPGRLRSSVQFLPSLFDLVDRHQYDPKLDTSGRTAPPSSIRQGVRFEKVSFTYPGADHPILRELDLWIPAGTSVALVGDNGAGKSTVVKLLCRFYDPDEGRITIDGTDLREFDLDGLRRHIGVLFQDFTRLPLNARDNVGVGCIEKRAETNLLDRAAAEAGAASIIDSLPAGWSTLLAREFGGEDLSGGEWQRIALARVLMTRMGPGASLLILDEPTAALDVRLEHDLNERFGVLTEGLTSLLVSHRFSTVRMADSVAVLEQGRIVEAGTHSALVAARSRYAELYELQARRFRRDG